MEVKMIVKLYRWSVLLLLVFSACNYKSEQADLIVHNGTIYTVDGKFTKAQAMAIKDGKILEVGAERQILNKYHSDQVLDVKQNFVYPGFIDAHCHFLGYGLNLQKLDLSGTDSFEEVLERVVEHSKNQPAGWIVGRGWDQNDWTDKRFPTKTKLDSLFPNRPVFLQRIDGHAALANQAALEKAGITAKTAVKGGMVVMENGKPTGLLIDNVVDLFTKILEEMDASYKKEALLHAQKNCFAVGLTTVDDAGLDRSAIELIDTMQRNGELKMRMYVMISDKKEEDFFHYMKSGPYKTERLNVRSVKFYADGALGSRGACLKSPYTDREQDHFGMLLNDHEYYKKCAEQLVENGFQMNTHCIGDSAVKLMLDVYAGVLQGTNDHRWRIEHAQVVAPEDFELFAKFNIIPSVQPTHATSDMYWAEDRLGEERIKEAYANQKLLQQNGMIALGTDFPVEDISPIRTFYAAVFRKDDKGFPEGGFQIENALTRKQALQGITIWAALANFEENEKGSLEAGKFADFVILNKDLMTAPENEILEIEVQHTFLNGEEVFSR